MCSLQLWCYPLQLSLPLAAMCIICAIKHAQLSCFALWFTVKCCLLYYSSSYICLKFLFKYISVLEKCVSVNAMMHFTFNDVIANGGFKLFNSNVLS